MWLLLGSGERVLETAWSGNNRGGLCRRRRGQSDVQPGVFRQNRPHGGVRVVWSRPALDFSDLLKLFWECHDPTQGNRQGNDTGSQYRSAIYTFTPQHLQQALASKDAYQASLTAKGYGAITTEILADQTFYFAEDYHQQYLAKPGSRPYCSAMPTQVELGEFEGSNYKLPEQVWAKYDWSISHCVLRSDNAPIQLSS